VLQVSDHIRLYLDGKHPEGRRRNKYANLLATVDTDKTAMIALKAIIATLYSPRNTQSVLVNIGARIEDELRFSAFEERHKEYYDEIVRSWESKRTKSTSHKRKVLSVKSRDLGMQWDQWSGEVRLGVGALVVSLLMEVCDLVEIRHEKGKNGGRAAILGPTDACIDWVMKHNEGAELGNPDRMPCIIQPEDWSDPFTGGYYSPLMRRRVPLVKGMNRAGRENLMNNAEMPEVLSAVNAMQRTGWRVNERVAEVMREVWHKNLSIGMPRSEPYVLPKCPLAEDQVAAELAEDSPDRRAFEEWKAAAREIHTMEKERVSQNLAVSRTLRMATDMGKYDAFYYVYQCDFRAACTRQPPAYRHRAQTMERAFSNSLRRSPSGRVVYTGSRYTVPTSTGSTKRITLAGSRGWMKGTRTSFALLTTLLGPERSGRTPTSLISFLRSASNTRRLTALEMRFGRVCPVALDGSCNGLQHFSAMLRDAVGGAAVNLTPAPAPADIYQEVADVATRKLRGLASMTGEAHGGAQNWLALFGPDGMPRKLSKKPVMTLPYGSTQQACTETIFRWTQENAPDFFADNTGFRHALYLSPKLWSSISEVVIAARQAMDWLQQCAGVLAKAGHPIQFTTPLGFPVRQSSMKFETHMIETQINGRLRLRFAKDTEELDSRKQRQGSSPNFVHSIDATHMMQVINASVAAGISSFAMIHDDFGVHACNVDEFHRIIREEFVRLHSIDLLRSFKEQHEEQFDVVLPDLPPIGELDITEVLQSPYFFG
jgi:DNA-directed RNA polymerase